MNICITQMNDCSINSTLESITLLNVYVKSIQNLFKIFVIQDGKYYIGYTRRKTLRKGYTS